MNALNRDREAYEQLKPSDVAAYLRAEGWTQTEVVADRFSAWTNQFQNEEIELLLPAKRSLSDYSLRMSELVPLIALKEQRPQREVIEDIQSSSADVIRIRFQHLVANDGTIPLKQGEALIAHAKEMMLAGACSTIQPKAYHANRRPDDAVQYMNQLRLGQTERGSYVLNIISPVSPSLGQMDIFNEPIEEPFERQAVTTLATALDALLNACNHTVPTPSAELFKEAVSKGVSANLCSAIVGMSGPTDVPTDRLRISFSFARTRPVHPSIPRDVIIESDHLGMIQEVGRLYRATASPEETEVRGIITQLRADDIAGPPAGPIVIKGTIDGKLRSIQITLAEKDHQLAVEAYKNRSEIVCNGLLRKQQAATWTLDKPNGFDIIVDN